MQIARHVRGGWRVEAQTEYQAVLVRGHRVNHVLHLLISVFTLGLWVIVWLLVAITGGERRKTIRAGDWAEPSEKPDDQIWQWVTENSVKVRDALRKRNG